MTNGATTDTERATPVAWSPSAGWKDSIDGDLHANGFYTRKKVVTSRWA